MAEGEAAGSEVRWQTHHSLAALELLPGVLRHEWGKARLRMLGVEEISADEAELSGSSIALR